MFKIFVNIILVIIVVLGINLSYKVYNDTSSQQDNVVNNLNTKTDISESKQKSTNSNLDIANKVDTNLDTENKTTPKTKKDTKNKSKTSKDDYSVLVSSNVYNALVSLDNETKEVNIEVLDNTSEVSDFTNYINISDENIKYLTENKDLLTNQFKEASLLTKYSLITKMLKDYDTDITSNDIINLGLKYLSSSK